MTLHNTVCCQDVKFNFLCHFTTQGYTMKRNLYSCSPFMLHTHNIYTHIKFEQKQNALVHKQQRALSGVAIVFLYPFGSAQAPHQ